MSAIDTLPGVSGPSDAEYDIPPGRTVIAAVVEWQGRIGLFRRSRSLCHDSGLWHCITGFVEPGVTPQQQALDELSEEAGLQAEDLLDLRQGPVLVLVDGSGTPWRVHTFTAVTSRRRLRLNWEHDCYRWTAPQKAKRFTNRVTWLGTVLNATGHCAAVVPEPGLPPALGNKASRISG